MSKLRMVRARSYLGGHNFTVSGGPLAKPQEFGWHVTDDGGRTVAVACCDELVARLMHLERLAAALADADALYHLRERATQGYVPEEKWDELEAALEAVLPPNGMPYQG